jgi:sortase A
MNMRPSSMRLIQRVFLGMGIVLLVYAAGSIAYAEIYQRYASRKFMEPGFATEGPDLPDLAEGDIVGKLEIARSGISVMVLQGVEEGSLRLGAGHVPGTPLPPIDGNVAVAAHRDTFFRKLEGIRHGDHIQFSTRAGTFGYIVTYTEIVDPEDTQVIESRGVPELTLISCYPFYYVGAAPHRFIVHAIPAKPLHGSFQGEFHD